MERGRQKRTTITNWQNGRSEWRRAEKAGEYQRVVLGTGIPMATYYSWQRKVFQAVLTEVEVCFIEISVRPAGRSTAANIESGRLQIEIYTGADAETVCTIIQELKECWKI